MKFMFALSVGFQNGMSWSHCTKTHKLVWFFGNEPFPDQGPIRGAHKANSPTQQYNFLAEQTLKFSVYFMQQIKRYSISTARHTDRQTHRQTDAQTDKQSHRQTDAHFASLYAWARFFLRGNLYLSLPMFLCLLHSLTLFVKDNYFVLKTHKI